MRGPTRSTGSMLIFIWFSIEFHASKIANAIVKSLARKGKM